MLPGALIDGLQQLLRECDRSLDFHTTNILLLGLAVNGEACAGALLRTGRVSIPPEALRARSCVYYRVLAFALSVTVHAQRDSTCSARQYMLSVTAWAA